MTKADRYRATTDMQVQEATGRNWREWVALLDAWNEQDKSLVRITRYLMQQYGIVQLWAQAIAVDYKWEHMNDDD